jgi:hypothetical protein
MEKLAPVLIVLLLTGSSAARTISVDDDGPADFNTIQAAIDDANAGDEIVVADGTYTGQGNRDIDFLGKAIMLRSQNGPQFCTIDCNGTELEPHRAIVFDNSEGPNSIVQGLTITNGYNVESFLSGGGAIECIDASPTIKNCIFKANYSVGSGGAVHFAFLSSPRIINCTFYSNSAYAGGAVGWDSCQAGRMSNCIIWANNPSTDPGIYSGSCGDFIYLPSPPLKAYYNDLQKPWQDSELRGPGNIVGDPCFVDPCNGDYHLRSTAGRWDPASSTWVTDTNTSLCIDAGNPGCDPADEPVPNGNRINMGAYGGTAKASKSPENWALLADLTNSRKVDSNDLGVFTDYWLDSNQCSPSNLDRSELVNLTDFAIFAQQFSGRLITGPGMTYQIGDCDGVADESSGEPNFSVWVEGRYIHFEDMVYANCCPNELGLEKEINGNQITLYEIGYGGMCDCMCYFPVTATLGPFEDGTYTVEVFDNYGQSLGIVLVVIAGPDEPGMAYHMADCEPQASDSLAAQQFEQTRFTVTVEGQYLHLEDMMVANCCPDKLELEMTVDTNLITIYEIETTTSPCRCICDFPVTATLGPFEPGTYTFEVFDNSGQSLGTVEVVISGLDEPGMAYHIADCDPAASASVAAIQTEQTRFTVTVEGQYLYFEDMMVANCCPEELGLEMTLEGNLITIFETEYTPGGCWCICDYPVTATLGPFEPGIYTLEVYEDYGGFIGSTSIIIEPGQ